MIEILGDRKCCSNSHFSDNMMAENISNVRIESTDSAWDNSDQY